MLALATTSGCTVSRFSTAEGKSFEIGRVSQIKVDMPKDAVTAAMGSPYASGVDLDGNPYHDYQYTVITNSGVGGGVVLTGYSGGISTNGATMHVVFHPATGAVRTVQYEISGQENYEKFSLGGTQQ
jgi:outer membrane protein assembly factor BamE (lipoprotein component of BamABCDE complex)